MSGELSKLVIFMFVFNNIISQSDLVIEIWTLLFQKYDKSK